MPYQTVDFIHLPNPDHPETDFRLNNKGNVNIVGTTNFGAGVQARLGLLKGTGKSTVYVYLFDKSKFTLEKAQTWLDKHKGGTKIMDDNLLTDKKFKFNMPLVKSYTDDNDGYLYLEYSLATTDTDLENEQLSNNALKGMATQAPSVNMYLEHKYGLDSTIGPVVEASIKDNHLFVKGRVRKQLEPTVKDILDSGTHMGGSFGGICQKDFMKGGVRVLDEVKLLDATFTPMPVNTATVGTATGTHKECTVCNQIFKSLEHKYNLNIKANSKGTSYEAIQSTLNNAVREKYENSQLGKYIYIKLTFPESIIVNMYGNGEDKLYEITYSIDDIGSVTLGDPVEVEEQYVQKKLEIFKIKSKTKMEEITMTEDNMKEFKEVLKENNVELAKAIKEALKPGKTKKESEPEEVKTIDEAKITENVTKGVLKALGIPEPEPDEPKPTGVIIMDQKALEDLQGDAVKKALIEIAKQREGTRKSKSVGGSKFEIPQTETQEEKTENKDLTGKVGTRKAAEMAAGRLGLIKAA